LANAFGLAGAFASGTAEFLADDDPWIKAIQVGHAAHDAIVAVRAASEGLVGPATILEGRYGYFRAHAGEGNYDLRSICENLGGTWELLRLYPKRYPCDHLAQGYVDCAIELAAGHQIRPEDVDELECVVHPLVVPVMFEPPDLRYRPPNAWSARWSMPFNVAIAMIDQQVTTKSYTDARTADARVVALMDRISYLTDDTLRFPIDYPAIVRARLTSGAVVTVSALKVKGTPENPMSPAEYIAKFRANAQDRLGADRCSEIIGRVQRLAEEGDLHELMDLMRTAG
jgi:2-methylcitrate dehydratase PrpD